MPEQNHIYTLGKSSGFSLRAIWALMRLIRTVRPQILHTHNLGPLIYSVLATMGGRTNTIIHGEHAVFAPWEKEARRILQRRKLYKKCRAVHTVSDIQLVELKSLNLNPEKLVAIANGVDTSRFVKGDRVSAKAKFGLPEGAVALGLVGRYGAFKGHSTLLAAFEKIAPKFPLAHLVFIGAGGPEEERIQTLSARSGFSSRIHLAGFHEDTAPLYQALDLLVIPSVNEGMSNAALESMASCVPVLANVGCGHEQFITNQQDGIIADLMTPDAIARELESILIAPERLFDLAEKARSTVEARFSISQMMDAYEKLYRAHAH